MWGLGKERGGEMKDGVVERERGEREEGERGKNGRAEKKQRESAT